MLQAPATTAPLIVSEPFADRHLGPGPAEVQAMLAELDLASLEDLIDAAVPESIRTSRPLDLPEPLDERSLLDELAALSERNLNLRSFLGMGYHGTFTPPVIRRNILENPGWYTQYTPYQAEIAQGRLEALLNFQTLVMDLTGMEMANGSMLDEATAAAEAMTMCRRVLPADAGDRFLVADDCHPQTIAVLRTRAEPLGIAVEVGRPEDWAFEDDVFGALVQYPATDGAIRDFGPICEAAHGAGALVVVAADLLALTLLREPAAFGADVVVGSAQRFGVPMGFGGPHAAFMATRENYMRQLPGRIVGVSKDAEGRPALRLALQTREQHIRRDRATSNICTAQVLLAVIAAMYAVYHGPEGLRRIALNVHRAARALAGALGRLGCGVGPEVFFDTLAIDPSPVGRSVEQVLAAALELGINLRDLGDGRVGIALDETVTRADLELIVRAFGGAGSAFGDGPSPRRDSDVEGAGNGAEALTSKAVPAEIGLPAAHARTSPFLDHAVFHAYRSETEMLRYLRRLESRDLSLTTSMIPLGSCTMKLNASAEMLPITLPGFSDLHPFAPVEQAEGYLELFERLEGWLAEITGFAAVSLQPNAGSQGEYTGLLAIRAWHRSRGDGVRDVCLIPTSAHGTNPASAVMAGMRVAPVRADEDGNIDLDDLAAKMEQHAGRVAALMITYPSTHGVFEPTVGRICDMLHAAGGQVYLDGANMNALVGVCRPADFGADICHLNLHKTFCIPHGGGGPGMGPVCAAEHLAPFLPGHPLASAVGGQHSIGPVSAAPWGSPSILPISYAYIAMMGAAGLERATAIAILNANYMASRLGPHYPVLYRGPDGYVAHECILDLRPLKAFGIEADDVAKRLMDYGFHAPTMSWPVAGTLMIEPTESESKAELDRFCEAMIAIREEVRAIETGELDRTDNMLKNAPHTALSLAADDWGHPYSRQAAAYPAVWLREHKYWPPVARIDNVYGDRNVVCACPPMEAYADSAG